MRVLHIDAGGMYGGVETFLLTLARDRKLCPEMEPEFGLCFEGRLAADLGKTGVWVHRLGGVRARNPFLILRARRRLARLLAGHRMSVVVCHMPWVHAVFGPAVRKMGLPLVFWLHSEANGRHWVERWASMTRPDLAVCNSKYSATTLDRIFPGVPRKVIYYPVAEAREDAPHGAGSAVRRELDTPDEDAVILQVGRLEEWKGHGVCLEALASLRAVPRWTCWMVGGAQRPEETEYLAKLKRKCAELGLESRVRFLGQRSDIDRLMAAADIFCQPNTSPEPFGIVFVEAMGAGLPVVSSASGGPLEIITAECGILVEPRNAQALAEVLRRLVCDQQLRESLGSAGRRRAARLCDPATQMRQTWQALAGVRGASLDGR